MNYNWCRAKLRLPGFNLWPEETHTGSKRKQRKKMRGKEAEKEEDPTLTEEAGLVVGESI